MSGDMMEGIVMGHNFKTLGDDMKWLRSGLDKWKAYGKELEQENARLKQQLARAKANEAGLGAQMDAMLEAHPNTPLREKTSIRYNDPSRNGAYKNKLVLIFDNAFDKKALELGIRDPKRIRGD